jgi:ribonuclease HII
MDTLNSTYMLANRQMPMLEPYYNPEKLEAGCDEAGRGCLAGPVVAAAVILPKHYAHPLLNDSKKVKEVHRALLAMHIRQEAIAWAIGEATPREIDEMNIAAASYLAMHRAIEQLSRRPELLLVDGKHFKAYKDIPHRCFIGGDGRLSAIAAASILAKTYRDAYMQQLAMQFPHYGWDTNVGYPTKRHQEGIRIWRLTEHHRRTYKRCGKGA